MIDKYMIMGGGILTLLMALFHFRFPVLFQLEQDFNKIGMPKARIHFTIHVALFLLFIGIGSLSVFYSEEMAKEFGVGFGICIMLASFWLWRTLWQIIYFKLPKGPKPKAPLIMHYSLTVVFALLALMYSFPIFDLFLNDK